jgi:hypothetical protein
MSYTLEDLSKYLAKPQETTDALVHLGQSGALAPNLFHGTKPNNVTSEGVHLVCFVIDGSGSMAQYRSDMAIAVNEGIAALKESKAYLRNATSILFQLAVYNGKLRIPFAWEFLNALHATEETVYQYGPEVADDCLKDSLLQVVTSIDDMIFLYHDDYRHVSVSIAIFCDGGTIGDMVSTEHVLAEIDNLKNNIGDSNVNMVFVGFGEHAAATGRELGFYDTPDSERKITLLQFPALSSEEGKKMLRKAMALVSNTTSQNLS